MKAPRSLLAAVLLMVAALCWGAAPVAAQEQVDEPLAELRLDALTPRVVTAAGPAVLTVTGEVVNTGDRVLSDLAVRVQRDQALTGEDSARAAVAGLPEAPISTGFSTLGSTLAPGQRIPFRVEVPLGAGLDQQALQITRPGVYPLLLNLNGTPEFGGPARLAAVPLLLPVLGTAAATERATPPLVPAPLTVVWPLVAEPVRLPSDPGEPLLLQSSVSETDPITEQIATGGRLDGLLEALEEVTPPGSPVAEAVCVAVDPALLETVDGMAAGYRVVTPAGTVDGTGSAEARRWLDRLRAVTAGRCVLPLPYADPDVVALSRAGRPDLAAYAASAGAQLVNELLGAAPLGALAWPPDGVLDERTLADLTSSGTTAVLLEPRGLAVPPVDTDSVSLPDATRGLVADPLLGAALAPADAPRPLPAQDAIGALGYRALDADPRPVLLVPPRRWEATGAEATALLRAAGQLVTAGFLTPRGLPGLLDPAAGGPPARLDYPVQAGTREIPPPVTGRVAQELELLEGLQAATARDATADLEPAALFDPLRMALLRGTSSAWRDEPARAAELVDAAATRLEELRRSVRIVPPPGPYTLGSPDAPLLLTVENVLPVSVDVTLLVEETPGLRAGTVGVQQVPARSSRQFLIPAEVDRAGRFTVDARLTTPGDTPLGQPTTLHLQSTALRTVTVALTAGAAAVLVLLVARRIARRVRAGREVRR